MVINKELTMDKKQIELKDDEVLFNSYYKDNYTILKYKDINR